MLTQSPSKYRKDVTDITNVNAYSSSFDFLKDEPDVYTREDVKKNEHENKSNYHHEK